VSQAHVTSCRALQVIAAALRNQGALQALDLTPPGDKGLVTGSGVKHLAQALAVNTVLQELSLSMNPVGDGAWRSGAVAKG
jgi:hypothetical protein